MKKLIYAILLSFISIGVRAQHEDVLYHITFDTSDLFTQQIGGGAMHFYPFENLICIDSNLSHNQWQIGRPNKTIFNSAYSIPYAIVTDTLNPCAANDTSVFTLKFSKSLWLGLDWVSFRYRLNIDTGDIAKIEYTTDTGHHWTNLATDTSGLFNMSDSINLLASTSGWDLVVLDANRSAMYLFSGDTITFRFTFIAGNSATPRDGWMLDEFIIGYHAESVVNLFDPGRDLTVYPNPGTTELMIKAVDRITSIAIIDVLGNIVHRQTFNSQTAKVNIADLPAGIYLVRVNDTEVRKFVKK